mmetsp:Transcript_46747/g.109037  ORF Transcript_46747/g.109037 Transcript_46747/m.109037 type:complete len:634 (-) Transcript_46747:158-2059(-)
MACADEEQGKPEEAAADKLHDDADGEDTECAPPSQGGRPVAAPCKSSVFITGKAMMKAGRETYSDLLDEEREDEDMDGPAQPPILDDGWQQLEGTPVQNASYHQRFLAWSDHGHSAFHPEEHKFEIWYASDEKPRHLVDKSGFDMMSMSSTATCLAASAKTSSEARSRIRIHPRRRWEKQSFEAAITPESGERVEAIACGEDFVAALTSSRLLRLYMHSGLPIGIISVPGRSIALAARGHVLLAVTGQCNIDVGKEEERLDFRFLDVRTRAVLASGHLPLSPGSQLRWLSITAELAPITIDTVGVVRALLGLGAGAWGSASGCGGEWVPVLSLAADEARDGPVWAVSAQHGVLFCAQQGVHNDEPLPDMLEDPEEAPERAKPRYGRGADLQEKRWCIPCGPMPAISLSLGELFADHLVALHASSMNLQGDQGSRASNWKSKCLLAFEELLQADELERALDITKSLLARGGSSLLNTAMDLAERAKNVRLGDEIKALLRVEVQPTELGQTVPKAVQHTLPPLFLADERSALDVFAGSSLPASSSMVGTLESQLPSRPSVPSVLETSLLEGLGSRLNSEEFVESMVEAEAPALPKVNPFARTKRPQVAGAQAPHFLRDALGAPATSERSAKSARR